jgi:two-component SAPR family response regulator
MPAVNGCEFIKEVKKINPKVKVILMSAFEIENMENQLEDVVKVDAFIKKPFSPNTLRNIVLQHDAK